MPIFIGQAALMSLTAGARTATVTMINQDRRATFHAMSSAMKTLMTTAPGVPIRNTAMCGCQGSLQAGPPIAKDIGPGSLHGVGPGSMTPPGVLLHSITAAG